MKRSFRLLFEALCVFGVAGQASGQETTVFADRLVSAEDFTVEYVLPTAEGQDISFIVDYPDSNPVLADRSMSEIELIGGPRPTDKDLTYHFTTTDNQQIEIVFSFSAREVQSIRIVPPRPSQGNQAEFFIESKGGFLIRVKAAWDGKEMSHFNMSPVTHPFPAS